jgi:hypothetical protein
LTGAITADISGRDLLKIAIGGLVSGLVTPLAPRLIERLFGPPGLWQLALLALPFAVVMCFVVATAPIRRGQRWSLPSPP